MDGVPDPNLVQRVHEGLGAHRDFGFADEDPRGPVVVTVRVADRVGALVEEVELPRSDAAAGLRFIQREADPKILDREAMWLRASTAALLDLAHD